MNNNMNDIKGAIFDLDGTVFDSMHIWSEIGLRFLKEKGIEPEPGIEDEFVKMSVHLYSVKLVTRHGANA